MTAKREGEYLSFTMRSMVNASLQQGKDVIDFTIGNPDLPMPSAMLETLVNEINHPDNHRYPEGESRGIRAFREAAAVMYDRRYGVRLDPDRELIGLIGSKEGARYLSLALLKPGDVVILCNPGYPTYEPCAELTGADIYFTPLLEGNGYLPDLGQIPEEVFHRTKLMIVNYPNNPIGAAADVPFYTRLIELAKRYEFIVCNDNAYGELYYEDPPASILSVPGALECAVELTSLSKTYNICGWRIGMIAGHADTVAKVLDLKQYTDAGMFTPFQKAAAAAMLQEDGYLDWLRSVYRARRDLLVEGLRELGFTAASPRAGMFIWAKPPYKGSSWDISRMLLEQCSIACNPGSGYGSYGEGFLRFSLCVTEERIKEAIARMKQIKDDAHVKSDYIPVG
ncbi:LL-diaminopimelate aminotransferase [Paenibacillus cellulosilyticus]|uniref:Aminotransferase n=1 Tax=Paenibacillus cellulosilyticus TaxID=375489 RepID=A0A2V2YTP1_9BACL|nr:aminotransferase class I/II-fold pyridoxal phosphate-dependent enzyme [Paenibacillus cellulosilyticus]PWW02853.1 LL-diaminopimelate aminotransferase [Paenibacillus cellulosilyticus]QKS45769.1 aminotransferase class I/II-fold pyridoxal phosphate-dependent enzyme [Paenibacillus cellulosilyticus]